MQKYLQAIVRVWLHVKHENLLACWRGMRGVFNASYLQESMRKSISPRIRIL